MKEIFPARINLIMESLLEKVSFDFEYESWVGNSDGRQQEEHPEQMYGCVKCRLFLSTKSP